MTEKTKSLLLVILCMVLLIGLAWVWIYTHPSSWYKTTKTDAEIVAKKPVVWIMPGPGVALALPVMITDDHNGTIGWMEAPILTSLRLRVLSRGRSGASVIVRGRDHSGTITAVLCDETGKEIDRKVMEIPFGNNGRHNIRVFVENDGKKLRVEL